MTDVCDIGNVHCFGESICFPVQLLERAGNNIHTPRGISCQVGQVHQQKGLSKDTVSSCFLEDNRRPGPYL